MNTVAKVRNMSATQQPDAAGSAVDRAYGAIQQMALNFRLRPGERVNESEISREIGVSRTPLREALNRLAAEEVLEFLPSKGFFVRQLRPREIYELYQIRLALEVMGIRLAARNATPEAISALRALTVRPRDFSEMSTEETVRYDEAFHEGLADVTGNLQLAKMLRSLNTRIRPLRHFGINRKGIDDGENEHRQIVEALASGDGATAEEILTRQISCRFDEVEKDVRQIYGDIYVG